MRFRFAFACMPAAIAALAGAATPGPAAAQGTLSVCPAALGGQRLTGATFFDGPLADNAALAPDESIQRGESVVNTWRFANRARITIRCSYGPEGARVSDRALRPEQRTCTARYRTVEGGRLALVDVGCR